MEKKETDRILTETEEKMLKDGVSRADIAQARLWNKRPDGIAIRMPKEGKQGKFVILEFKTDTGPPRMGGRTSKLHSRSALTE